jgi:hypothetical protein
MKDGLAVKTNDRYADQEHVYQALGK